MTQTPNNDTGIPSSQGASHIVIDLGYSCKLLLPIELAGTFLDLYSQGREFKEDYGKPIKILAAPPSITLRYLTDAQIAKFKFDDMLGLDNDE